MDQDEAREWIEGKRSMANMIPQDPYETWELRFTQADAAKTQQAYYVLKAYSEGLIKD